MRSVLLLIIVAIAPTAFATVPSSKQIFKPSIESLNIEINRNPDAIAPKIALAKELMKMGNNIEAHAYISEVLNRHPETKQAQMLMKNILLSDTPYLGNPVTPNIETKMFKISFVSTKYEFVKTIQLDAIGERWENIFKENLKDEKTLVILFESDESFVAASNGEKRVFASINPRIIGISPNLNRDQFVDAFKNGLISLWTKLHLTNSELPPGMRGGLVGALSPIINKPSSFRPVAIIDIIERPPTSKFSVDTTTSFLIMLHELNPQGFPIWLKTFGTKSNPMKELLTTFRFNSWSEVHNTFRAYLKQDT